MVQLSKPTNRFVWLRGSPGTGKTAIAKSIAEELDKRSQLAASFFFDKSGSKSHTDSPELFVSTLAHQLANFNPRYRAALFQTISPDNWVLPGTELDQLENLILEPLRRLSEQNPASFPPSIIVLDGLDECGDPRTLERFMSVIIELSRLPPNF